MVRLEFYVVPFGKKFVRDVDPGTDTVDGLLKTLQHEGLIPPPLPDGSGGMTIWKMGRAGKKDSSLITCTPGDGINGTERIYIFAAP